MLRVLRAEQILPLARDDERVGVVRLAGQPVHAGTGPKRPLTLELSDPNVYEPKHDCVAKRRTRKAT